MPGRPLAYFKGLIGALFWMGSTLLVALPDLALQANPAKYAHAFMANTRNEAIFVPILLGVDIVIMMLLGTHSKISRFIGWAFGCTLFYGITVGVVGQYRDYNTGIDVYICFILALGCLTIPRFLSFAMFDHVQVPDSHFSDYKPPSGPPI